MAVAAAFVAAIFSGLDTHALLPYSVAAAIPVGLMIMLWPVIDKEWAQMLVIFSWIALAIAACIAVAFVPMAVLFLCAPAAASLFEKEKVVEAMFLSALFAIIIYYAGRWGFVPDSVAGPEQSGWAKNTGLMATVFLMVAAMFGAAKDRGANVVSNAAPVTPQSENLLSSVPGALIHVDENDETISLSPLAYDMFGINRDVSKFPLAAIWLHDETARINLSRLMSKARSENKKVTEILSVELAKGEVSHLEFTLTPMEDGAVGVCAIDMTQSYARMKTLEHDAELAQKDASGKTLFFAGVSHELRTPLNAIIGFSDMMRSRLFGPLPNKYAEYADLIHDSGQHMLDLIGDVLDLSKAEAGKYTLHYDTFDAADVIRSSIKMTRPLADNAEVHLDAEIAVDQELMITADRKALRQILLNLLSNAVKFTAKGGRVVVTAKLVAGTLNLTVADNGSGMSAEELQRIGTPFEQTDSARLSDTRGSGLGLSLVKSLVELHAGRMSITSQANFGTTVDVYIPQSNPKKSNPEE